jgi:hypothetical protein
MAADTIHHQLIIPALILNHAHTIGLRKYVPGKTIIITVSGLGCGKNAAIGVDLKGLRALYSIDRITKGVYYEKNRTSGYEAQVVGRSNRRTGAKVTSSAATRDQDDSGFEERTTQSQRRNRQSKD